MAISSYGVQLMKGTTASGSTTYSKLIDIKSFPALGGAPEMLETTTLSDKAQTFINGIQKMQAMEFTANYTVTDFETLKDLEGDSEKYAIYFGSTGADGKYGWEGELSVWIDGADVNGVVNMKISISPSTVIAKITA